MVRSPRLRVVALLTLLLHLLGVGGVPLADARAELASWTTAAHVESRDQGGCPAAHDHVACTLCRLIEEGPGSLPTLAAGERDLLPRDWQSFASAPRAPAAPLARVAPARAPPATT